MTHVVTESCINCLYTDCVDVCPVDCFHKIDEHISGGNNNQADNADEQKNQRRANFLVIDPDECIDCAVCVAECPVTAIYAEEDVPSDQQEFIALNVELAQQWPTITRSQPPLPDADHWKDITDKKHLLKR